MREILFRGKSTEFDTWLYGCYTDKSQGSDFPAICSLIGADVPLVLEVDPATVGQYTGLKDKNGKKIFEGDIVIDLAIRLAGVVVWNDEYGQFGVNDVHDGYQDYASSFYDCVVVGNIHDNPELLQEATP